MKIQVSGEVFFSYFFQIFKFFLENYLNKIVVIVNIYSYYFEESVEIFDGL